MQPTNIEYLTHTWNPIVMRCTRLGPECDNCWHLRACHRLAANPSLPPERRSTYAGWAQPYLDTAGLEAPLEVTRPAVIGVQFMGDLFHGDVSQFLPEVFGVMRACTQHVFVLLTKRPQNITNRWCFEDNQWVGVSIGKQTSAVRWTQLCRLRLPHCWVSAEPLLEPVVLPGPRLPDFIAAGPETGPKHRPCDPRWLAALTGQTHCFFDKSDSWTCRHLPREWPALVSRDRLREGGEQL